MDSVKQHSAASVGKTASIIRGPDGQKWVLFGSPDNPEGFMFDVDAVAAIYPMDDSKANNLGASLGTTVMLNDSHGSTTFVRMLRWPSMTVAKLFGQMMTAQARATAQKQPAPDTITIAE